MRRVRGFAGSAALALATNAAAQTAPFSDQAMPGMTMPFSSAPTNAIAMPDTIPKVPGIMGGGSMAGMAGMDMAHMPAALGPYLMNRESSGTSWQPDASPHEAFHIMAGD